MDAAGALLAEFTKDAVTFFDTAGDPLSILDRNGVPVGPDVELDASELQVIGGYVTPSLPERRSNQATNISITTSYSTIPSLPFDPPPWSQTASSPSTSTDIQAAGAVTDTFASHTGGTVEASSTRSARHTQATARTTRSPTGPASPNLCSRSHQTSLWTSVPNPRTPHVRPTTFSLSAPRSTEGRRHSMIDMADQYFGPDSALLHGARAKAREILAATIRGLDGGPVAISDPVELAATFKAMMEYAVYLVGLLAEEMDAEPEDMLDALLERMHKHERARLSLVEEEE